MDRSVKLAALFLLTSSILWSGIARPVAAQEPGWSGPVSLSSDYPTSYLPDIAADQAGNLYAVWAVQFTERDEGWADGIGFSRWDGTSWSEAVDIFGQEMYHLPSIAVDSRGRLHVLGLVYTSGGVAGQYSELRYSSAWAQQHPEDARAWTSPSALAPGLAAYWNDILVDGQDRVHVVFAGWDPTVAPIAAGGECVGDGCGYVYYTRSTDGGNSWTAPIKISPGGGRVHIAKDSRDGLYVVWSTEMSGSGSTFVPSTNGFAYSPDGGATWSEPDTPLPENRPGANPAVGVSYDYWLSVAVDSRQTVHIVTVGGGIRHFLKQDLEGPWIEDTVPPLGVEGLGPGYGFRGIAVDSDDNLHFVLPTAQQANSSTPPGLFHAVWNRQNGWSQWSRLTTNARGKGLGLGNVAISGGNRLNVVWFEHLEGSAGHLFSLPRGRIEIYYGVLDTGARAVAPVPLPAAPSSAPISPPEASRPSATSFAPPAPGSAAAAVSTVLGESPIQSTTSQTAGLAVGLVSATVLMLGVVLVSLARRRR